MTLIDLHETTYTWWLPLQLLNERQPHESISHRALPSWDDHCSFIVKRPYAAWYWFPEPKMDRPAGCVYLTRNREIGVGVLRQFRGQGLAAQAIRMLMDLHPGRFLCNINPANTSSIALFRKLGFGPEPIQITLEKTK